MLLVGGPEMITKQPLQTPQNKQTFSFGASPTDLIQCSAQELSRIWVTHSTPNDDDALTMFPSPLKASRTPSETVDQARTTSKLGAQGHYALLPWAAFALP